MTRRKYVHSFIDDRYGKAKARYYFRRRGHKQVPLPGMPGSIEFEQAYAAAMRTSPCRRPSAPSASASAASMPWSSPISIPRPFSRSRPTQATYRLILEAFTCEHGAKPLAPLTRKHLEAMLARKMKTPAAGNHWLRLIKTLMRFAVREQLRADDPARDIDYIKRKAAGFHTWTEDEIAQFEAHHPIGARPGWRSRCCSTPPSGAPTWSKWAASMSAPGSCMSGSRRPGPCSPSRCTLPYRWSSTRRRATPDLPDDAYGKPFTAAGFGNWFRDQCDAAGLPAHCAAHGLRKAACRRLAEAGCSANVIASISGHTTLREVERYTKAADQERMARQGMAAIISRTGSGNGH